MPMAAPKAQKSKEMWGILLKMSSVCCVNPLVISAVGGVLKNPVIRPFKKLKIQRIGRKSVAKNSPMFAIKKRTKSIKSYQ